MWLSRTKQQLPHHEASRTEQIQGSSIAACTRQQCCCVAPVQSSSIDACTRQQRYCTKWTAKWLCGSHMASAHKRQEAEDKVSRIGACASRALQQARMRAVHTAEISGRLSLPHGHMATIVEEARWLPHMDVRESIQLLSRMLQKNGARTPLEGAK